MSFDAESFCQDYRVDLARRGSKHYRPGWVNVPCPFCTGNPGYHGGFKINEGYYNCHRCGNHWIPKAISGLLKISIPAAKKIAEKYFTQDQITDLWKDRPYADKLILPAGAGPLNPRHKAYLRSREFDCSVVQGQWDILGTPGIGTYRNRIVAPIRLNGKLISYQTRDITDRHMTRYMACPEEEEVWHHKFTLYGIDHARDTGLGLEGITDVWRMGYGSVAFFGIEFTLPQVLMVKRKFKRFFIMFDNDPQAQENADRLGSMLTGLNVDVEIITNDSNQDPAEMNQKDADNLMKDLGIFQKQI